MKQLGRPKKPEVQEIIKQCNEIGISYVNYLNRINKGWTKFEALNTPKMSAMFRTKDGTPIFTYLKSIGKNYNYFITLIHQGYSVEDALDKVVNSGTKVKYIRDGISLRQWCIKNGKNYVTEYKKLMRRKK